ncbi:PH domain-containing protein [Saccharomonospora saliphila]|uniref:PH domain-containing protein n=1 Tax=Saccharomonospora saliphila TaxID=369829 RepID=UPI000A05058E|nr:PH domain-containing protein [Saccharomonospora saliphila]
MDNSAAWAPRPALVGAGWALTAAAGAALAMLATGGDRQGALLLSLVTAALAALSAHGTVVRPRLAADAGGVSVRTLGGTRRLAWSRVAVRLTDVRRFGRRVPVLELDADDARDPGRAGSEQTGDAGDAGVSDEPGLVVLGWIELGADPHDVHDELLRLRRRA